MARLITPPQSQASRVSESIRFACQPDRGSRRQTDTEMMSAEKRNQFSRGSSEQINYKHFLPVNGAVSRLGAGRQITVILINRLRDVSHVQISIHSY